MKRVMMILVMLIAGLCNNFSAEAQCSICTRTANQLGHKPAKALNAGILYLAAAPLMIAGFIGYRWMKSNGGSE